MVASKLANLQDGQKKSGAQICAPVSQPEAAVKLNVSRRTVQAAKQVRDHKAELQRGTPLLSDLGVGKKQSHRWQDQRRTVRLWSRPTQMAHGAPFGVAACNFSFLPTLRLVTLDTEVGQKRERSVRLRFTVSPATASFPALLHFPQQLAAFDLAVESGDGRPKVAPV